MTKISIPKRTIVQCGLAAVSSVLLLSWLHIRPLGIFFLALFGFWFYKTRCNLRIVPPVELEKQCKNWMDRLRDWRQNQPTMFCVVSSGCLGILAILGHLLSGSTMVLMGLVLAALMSTKYNFKLVKIEHKDFAWTEKLHHDAEPDDEFIPDVDDINRFVLERASDLATLSSPTEDGEAEDEKSDEIPSELLIPDVIPEIDEKSSDDDEEALVPVIQKEQKLINNSAAAPHTTSTMSHQVKCSKSATEVMEFKRRHFKRDSSLSTTSSSSEESLSKGLQFPDITTVDAPARALMQLGDVAGATTTGAAADLADNLDALKTQTQALLPSLLSGVVQWSMGGGGIVRSGSATAATQAQQLQQQQQQQRVVTALDSSDESDFEILENEDFK